MSMLQVDSMVMPLQPASAEIVAMLLEKGADINAQGGLYGSALQAASAEGKEEIVAMLLEKGADANAQDGIYGNMLLAATAQGKEKIVEILLEKRPDANDHGWLQDTTLQEALAEEGGRRLRDLWDMFQEWVQNERLRSGSEIKD